MPDSANRALRQRGLERQELTLHLRYEDHDTKHYCFFCSSRKPIFVARGRVFAAMYGNNVDEHILVIPVGIQCPECGAVYRVKGLNM